MSFSKCQFCGRGKEIITKLVTGGEGAICNDCITLCMEAISSPDEDGDIIHSGDKTEAKERPSPKTIKEHLDRYVIGHDTAKEVLSVAVYNHYKRLDNLKDDVELDKSNILLLGPTGSGKTLIAKTIAKFLDVPFAVADASSLTEAGYVGDDVESILTRLLMACDGDVAKAERGIVYIDEIDKKRSRSSNSGQRDVSGEGVQQSLLKLIEGSDVFVPPSGSKKNNNHNLIKVNTENILFIVGGAFVGLDEVVRKSKDAGSTIGFGAKPKNEENLKDTMSSLEPDHLVKYGLIPELVGRLPVRAVLDELSEEQLVHILTQPKNAIVKQFSRMFEIDGVRLVFEDDALKAIAAKALEQKTGARGLRTIIENILMKTQFRLPELKNEGIGCVRVHEGVITAKVEPILESEEIQA